MEKKELIELFKDGVDGEFLQFHHVENKLSKRADLNALLLLDSLVDSEECIIADVGHDTVYLTIDIDQLSKAITDESQVLDLIRCGVLYERESESLVIYP